jgi:hypothetical protein
MVENASRTATINVAEYYKPLPPELDADMTPGDIADVLGHLRFGKSADDRAMVLIDRGVRDFLVAVLRRK